MKKAIFIVPYFGNIPAYFPIWEQSAGGNSEFDFIIFTDSKINSNYPNIFIENFEFEQFLNIFREFFDEHINIKKPYKLCDLRPMYGEVLNEYIKEYQYWGYCDLDMCIGDLSKFIGAHIDNRIPKIGRQGHMTLMLNDKKINRLYRSNKGIFNYKEILNNEELYAFDEMAGINYICNQEDINSVSINSADISPIYKSYKDVRDDSLYQLFYYKNGCCYKISSKDGITFSNAEVAAVHFQKKAPCFNTLNINQQFIFLKDKIISNNYDLLELKNIAKQNRFSGIKVTLEKYYYYFKKIKTLLLKGKKQINIRVRSNRSIRENLKQS